jgi:LPS sulfotransferase NodH
MSAGNRSIVFCATQRTGSAVITDDLSNLCGGRPFNSEFLYGQLVRGEKHPPWESVWKTAARRCRVKGYVVSKVMFHYLPYLATAISGRTVSKTPPIYTFAPERCDAFYEFFRESTWVHIRRRDIFSQAVSMYFAEMTKLWEIRPWRMEQVPREAPWVPYDRTRLMRYVRAFATENAGWREFFTHYGIVPIQVDYEDAIDNYPAYLDPVLATMGVKRTKVPERRMIKLGNATNARYANALRRDVMDHPILRSMVA